METLAGALSFIMICSIVMIHRSKLMWRRSRWVLTVAVICSWCAMAFCVLNLYVSVFASGAGIVSLAWFAEIFFFRHPAPKDDEFCQHFKF